MNNQYDELFDKLILPQVDNFMPDDSYFQSKATPLKKAAVIREEHRKQFIEQLKMNDLRHHLEEAEQLIRKDLSKLISEVQVKQVFKEMDGAPKHFVKYAKSYQKESGVEVPLMLEQLKDKTNPDLKQIYEMAVDCIQNKNYSEASSLLHFLITTTSDKKDTKTTKKLRTKAKHYMQAKLDKIQPIEEKLFLLQHAFGYSDNTLLHIYELAVDCIQNQKYKEATSLLYYLAILAPDIPGYWLGLGVCLQAINEDQEALDVFDVVKNIQKHNPAPYIYSAEIYIKLHDNKKADKELHHAEDLIQEAKPEDRNLYNNLKNNLLASK